MKFIQFRYAKYFNSRHKVDGHVFQGRYYSKLIDSESYFLSANKYIHIFIPIRWRRECVPNRRRISGAVIFFMQIVQRVTY